MGFTHYCDNCQEDMLTYFRLKIHKVNSKSYGEFKQIELCHKCYKDIVGEL